MDSARTSRLARWTAILVYLSVALGALLLMQVSGLLPQAVFYSILIGWLAYIVAAILIAMRKAVAYPLVFVLAVLTLVVSLPQPAHYAFISSAQILAASTFLAGSVVQAALIALVGLLLIRGRKH